MLSISFFLRRSLAYSSQDGLAKTQCEIDQDKCKNCKMCVKTGCPALISTKDNVTIDRTSCNGCTVCKQVCPFDAIEEVTL